MPHERIPLYYHEDYVRLTQTPGHPESPDRIKAIMDLIEEVSFPVEKRNPESLDPELLVKAHDEDHVSRIRDFGVGFMDPDTYHHEMTFDMSLRAAGGVVSAMEDAVRRGEATFAVPRPPGHHAGYNYNMGFCYFNNVAIAARMALQDHGDIERVAILDIDAHHGNGTADIFARDPDVLYISTHQWGIFPGTGHQNEVGRGPGEGKMVNLPLMGGSGDPSFKECIDEFLVPITTQFDPDLILVSIGGDSHIMDPLTSLTLSTPGYLDIISSIKDIGEKVADGRIIYELEGGYHPRALAEMFVGTMNQYLEEPIDIPIRYIETREAMPDNMRIKQFREVQSSYWKV
jgi:acetoin utilization deacetylase AcuC-like enzyme